MSDNPYRLPADEELITAANQAAALQRAANAQRARIACTGIAAAIQGILTNYEPGGAFDATGLELRLNGKGSVWVTGTYWASTGEARRIENDSALSELQEEVVFELERDNRSGWEPLCEVIDHGPDGTLYRLDLIKAAALPEPSYRQIAEGLFDLWTGEAARTYPDVPHDMPAPDVVDLLEQEGPFYGGGNRALAAAIRLLDPDLFNPVA